jgi:hypothetical protein
MVWTWGGWIENNKRDIMLKIRESVKRSWLAALLLTAVLACQPTGQPPVSE